MCKKSWFVENRLHGSLTLVIGNLLGARHEATCNGFADSLLMNSKDFNWIKNEFCSAIDATAFFSAFLIIRGASRRKRKITKHATATLNLSKSFLTEALLSVKWINSRLETRRLNGIVLWINYSLHEVLNNLSALFTPKCDLVELLSIHATSKELSHRLTQIPPKLIHHAILYSARKQKTNWMTQHRHWNINLVLWLPSKCDKA